MQAAAAAQARAHLPGSRVEQKEGATLEAVCLLAWLGVGRTSQPGARLAVEVPAARTEFVGRIQLRLIARQPIKDVEQGVRLRAQGRGVSMCA